MREEKKQCDILVIGGGVAGMMAAIRASEGGAKVIVAEKANTMRSGAALMGVDHFRSYIPEYHGDFSEFAKDLSKGQQAPMFATKNMEYIKNMFELSTVLVKKWEDWGIPIKYHGKYHFAGHCFPGEKPSWLKISGMSIKPVLTRQGLSTGAQIMNRVMVFDILKNNDGKIVGAIGIHTREDTIITFEAKAVILTTGCLSGLYPSPSQAGVFNRAYPLTNSGDGRIMAYRAGAELADIEMIRRHAGPKYFIRSGQASWVGVLRDRNGKAIGQLIDKPDARYGDMTIEVNKEIFEQYKLSGKGPIYMDMNGISDSDYEEMVHYLRHQCNIAILDNIASQGVNLQKAAIEFTTFEHAVANGIQYDHKGETGVDGLYAAGDEHRGGLGPAAVIGWAAGENAAKYVSKINSADINGAKIQIEESVKLCNDIRGRDVGANWKEGYGIVQAITHDYCGSVRSQLQLDAGLDTLRRMRVKALESLKANNTHELMFCLQSLNLFDLAELLLMAANDRKETRELHVRADYPLINPTLSGKKHIIKQQDGKPVFGWKAV